MTPISHLNGLADFYGNLVTITRYLNQYIKVNDHLDQKITSILWNLMLHYGVHETLSIISNLSQINPLDILQHCFCKTVLTTTLPIKLRSPR